jgi:hypothetical protein
MSYQTVILADNPAAFWPLNETSGTVAHDLSGNGWNGTYEGGVTLADNPFPAGGSGATFNGTDGYVYGGSGVPTGAVANVTMEVWLNFNGNTNQQGGCAFNNGTSSLGGYAIGNGSGTMTSPGNYIIGLYQLKTWNPSTVTIPLFGWRHLVNVINADSSSTFFLNGLQVAHNSNNGINAPTLSWSIAADSSGDQSDLHFEGSLANVAIYNKALTAAQIFRHYNAGIATPSGSPLYSGGGTDLQFLLLQR